MQDKQLIIGDAIKTYCEENGLVPFTHEWTENIGQSTQAKAWTTEGLVIASPDSGVWTTAGPFGDAG